MVLLLSQQRVPVAGPSVSDFGAKFTSVEIDPVVDSATPEDVGAVSAEASGSGAAGGTSPPGRSVPSPSPSAAKTVG